MIPQVIFGCPTPDVSYRTSKSDLAETRSGDRHGGVYRRTWQFLRKGADKVAPVPALAVTPSRVPGWQIIILFRLRIIAISNSRNFAC